MNSKTGPIARVIREEVWTWSRIVFGVLLLLVMLPVYRNLIETRFYRDVTFATPFYAVVVTHLDVGPDGLTLNGEMIKRRCEYQSMDAYITRGLLNERVILDTAPEDGQRPTGNRQPSPKAQLWGPWLIKVSATLPPPDTWEIYANHLCPDGQIQHNLFAEGAWPK